MMDNDLLQRSMIKKSHTCAQGGTKASKREAGVGSGQARSKHMRVNSFLVKHVSHSNDSWSWAAR